MDPAKKASNVKFVSTEVFLMIRENYSKWEWELTINYYANYIYFLFFNLTSRPPDRRQLDYTIDVTLSKALLCPKLYSCKQNRELWSGCSDFVS